MVLPRAVFVRKDVFTVIISSLLHHMVLIFKIFFCLGWYAKVLVLFPVEIDVC